MKAVCFSAPSQYELVIEGRKVAGSAQKRHGQVFLQHGSIPVEMDLELLGKALKTERTDSPADSLNTVGWLNYWSKQPVLVSDVEKILAETFAEQLQIDWLHSVPAPDEIIAAQKMSTEKYANPDWTMKR